MDINENFIYLMYPHKAFSFSNGYFLQGNKSVDIAILTAEIMDAKNEADMINIFRSHNLSYPSVLDFHKLGNAPPKFKRKKQDQHFESLFPSYTSWLLKYRDLMVEWLKLYIICLPIAHSTSNLSETNKLFTILHHASCVNKLMNEQKTPYFVSSAFFDSAIRRRIAVYAVPTLPLATWFDNFQDTYERVLQSKHGHSFKKVLRRGDMSPPRSTFHYWDNPEISSEVRTLLQDYAASHPTEGDQYITTWDCKSLAEEYLRILDCFIDSHLANVKLQTHSAHGTIALITDNLETTLTLWLCSQIQQHTSYRVCKMCGRPFILKSKKERKYCYLHEKHEINYYNKTIKDVQRNSSLDVEI